MRIGKKGQKQSRDRNECGSCRVRLRALYETLGEDRAQSLEKRPKKWVYAVRKECGPSGLGGPETEGRGKGLRFSLGGRRRGNSRIPWELKIHRRGARARGLKRARCFRESWWAKD